MTDLIKNKKEENSNKEREIDLFKSYYNSLENKINVFEKNNFVEYVGKFEEIRFYKNKDTTAIVALKKNLIEEKIQNTLDYERSNLFKFLIRVTIKEEKVNKSEQIYSLSPIISSKEDKYGIQIKIINNGSINSDYIIRLKEMLAIEDASKDPSFLEELFNPIEIRLRNLTNAFYNFPISEKTKFFKKF